MRTNFSNLGLRWGATALNAVAPRDAQGQPQTALALSDGDRRLLMDRLLAACDARDGASDGLVFDAHQCDFDPQVLACPGSKDASCLDPAQVEAVKKVMAGPKTIGGRQVYPGYLYDTGIVSTHGLPGVLVGPPIPEGKIGDTSMDVDAEAARAADARAMLGDTNAWTNLSGFRGRKGKLLFFHGNSDPWFSSLDTVKYYERLAADNGPAPLNDWSRLFLVPGMGHCGGGDRTLDRFDMLSAVVDWVEKDIAPERITATGLSMPGESRPLCPYPQYAHYEKPGDPHIAASYRCSN